MNLPADPPTFRPPTADERPWTWRLEDGQGRSAIGQEGDAPRFLTQADAESWLGEHWQELLADGTEQVTLVELDRDVYGPMSLHAE